MIELLKCALISHKNHKTIEHPCRVHSTNHKHRWSSQANQTVWHVGSSEAKYIFTADITLQLHVFSSAV